MLVTPRTKGHVPMMSLNLITCIRVSCRCRSLTRTVACSETGTGRGGFLVLGSTFDHIIKGKVWEARSGVVVLGKTRRGIGVAARVRVSRLGCESFDRVCAKPSTECGSRRDQLRDRRTSMALTRGRPGSNVWTTLSWARVTDRRRREWQNEACSHWPADTCFKCWW